MQYNCQNQWVPDSTLQKFCRCQALVAPIITQALNRHKYTKSPIIRNSPIRLGVEFRGKFKQRALGRSNLRDTSKNAQCSDFQLKAKKLQHIYQMYYLDGFSKLWITVQLRLVVAVALNSLLQVSVARFTQLRKHSIQRTVLWSAVLCLSTESSILPAADLVFRVLSLKLA